MSIQKIKQAINDSLFIEFTYNYLPRVFSAHLMGQKNSEFRIFGYQFEGKSSSNDIPCWKCFKVSKISQLVLKESGFKTIPTSGRPQTCIDQITLKNPNCT